MNRNHIFMLAAAFAVQAPAQAAITSVDIVNPIDEDMCVQTSIDGIFGNWCNVWLGLGYGPNLPLERAKTIVTINRDLIFSVSFGIHDYWTYAVYDENDDLMDRNDGPVHSGDFSAMSDGLASPSASGFIFNPGHGAGFVSFESDLVDDPGYCSGLPSGWTCSQHFTGTSAEWGYVSYYFLNPEPGSIRVTYTTTIVPEPATWLMLVAGFGVVGVSARFSPAGRAGPKGAAAARSA